MKAKVVELMEGIAAVPLLAGFGYTQLTDIEQERNGLLTHDRRPKVDVERVATAVRTVGEPSG